MNRWPPVSDALTPMEQRLAGIWRLALRLETTIGPAENFLALGGDSIKMMQVLSMVREEFGVELDQRLLLQPPTLRQLGQMIASPVSEL